MDPCGTPESVWYGEERKPGIVRWEGRLRANKELIRNLYGTESIAIFISRKTEHID